MKKVKLAIIGAGKIAEVLHIPNALISEFAELIAISEKNQDRLEYIKRKFDDGKIHFYTDYLDLLKSENIDAVIVTVPNFLHAKVSIDSLKSGKHVLVEKPMATTSKEAVEMIEAAKQNAKILMVNQSQRFFPHHQKAKEIIDSGLIGNIRLVKTMFGHSGPENWSPNASWFFQKETAMFGALGDLGVHKVDLIRFLTNLEIVECAAFLGTLEKQASVEDIASAILKLSNGAFATLDANWITKGLEENYIAIYGEKGTLKIGQTDPTKIDIYLSKPVTFHGEIVVKPLFTNEDPYWKMPIVDHFAKVCLGLEEPVVKAEDGYVAIKIVEKLFESFVKKEFVVVNE